MANPSTSTREVGKEVLIKLEELPFEAKIPSVKQRQREWPKVNILGTVLALAAHNNSNSIDHD